MDVADGSMKENVIYSCMREYVSDLDRQLKGIPLQKLEKFINILKNAYKNEKNIFIIGNGGSAATASHFSCDLGRGTIRNLSDKSEKRFKVTSLTTNIATMTAIANDISYDEIFSQQLLNIMSKGDVLIAISASGNSKNILNAAEAAKKSGLTVLGMTGFDGGKLKEISDYSIIVKSNSYGVVEDMHLILQHIMTYCLKKTKDTK